MDLYRGIVMEKFGVEKKCCKCHEGLTSEDELYIYEDNTYCFYCLMNHLVSTSDIGRAVIYYDPDGEIGNEDDPDTIIEYLKDYYDVTVIKEED